MKHTALVKAQSLDDREIESYSTATYNGCFFVFNFICGNRDAEALPMLISELLPTLQAVSCVKKLYSNSIDNKYGNINAKTHLHTRTYTRNRFGWFIRHKNVKWFLKSVQNCWTFHEKKWEKTTTNESKQKRFNIIHKSIWKCLQPWKLHKTHTPRTWNEEKYKKKHETGFWNVNNLFNLDRVMVAKCFYWLH